MSTLAIILLAGGQGGIMGFLPLVIILVIFYFFLIRPQSKRQKEQNAFLDELQKGDKIVTASGMLGQISKIEEEIVTLELGSKTFIQVTKSAVSKDMTEQVYGKKP